MKDCEEKAVAGVRHVVSICYSRGKYGGREALQILNVISKKIEGVFGEELRKELKRIAGL